MIAEKKQPGPLHYVACYALWIALGLALGWVLGELHSTWLRISLALEVNHWVARTVRQWLWPFLGLIWLVIVFWLEHHFRTGLHAGRLLIRALRFAGVVAGLYIVVVVIRMIT
jgi:hypothetical protein